MVALARGHATRVVTSGQANDCASTAGSTGTTFKTTQRLRGRVCSGCRSFPHVVLVPKPTGVGLGCGGGTAITVLSLGAATESPPATQSDRGSTRQ